MIREIPRYKKMALDKDSLGQIFLGISIFLWDFIWQVSQNVQELM